MPSSKQATTPSKAESRDASSGYAWRATGMRHAKLIKIICSTRCYSLQHVWASLFAAPVRMPPHGWRCGRSAAPGSPSRPETGQRSPNSPYNFGQCATSRQAGYLAARRQLSFWHRGVRWVHSRAARSRRSDARRVTISVCDVLECSSLDSRQSGFISGAGFGSVAFVRQLFRSAK